MPLQDKLRQMLGFASARKDPVAPEDVYLGRFYIPNFERLDPALREELRATIKHDLDVNPGHGKGTCAIEAQAKCLTLNLQPSVSKFPAITEAEFRRTFSTQCEETFQLACSSGPEIAKSDNTVRILSHGMLYYLAIMLALFARMTGTTDEDSIETISRSSFIEIADRAAKWFWDPKERGKGLVLAPVERFSRSQLKFYYEMLLSSSSFLIAHEIGHFELTRLQPEEAEVKYAREDLKEELSKHKILESEWSLDPWATEILADHKATVSVMALPEIYGPAVDDD